MKMKKVLKILVFIWLVLFLVIVISSLSGTKAEQIVLGNSDPIIGELVTLERIPDVHNNKTIADSLKVVVKDENFHSLIFYWFIVPAVCILLISILYKFIGAGYQKLFIFYIAVLIAVFVGVFAGMFAGELAGVLVGAFTGVFAGWLTCMLACGPTGAFIGAFAGAFAGGLAGVLATSKQGFEIITHYIMFLLTVMLCSLFIAWLADEIKAHVSQRAKMLYD